MSALLASGHWVAVKDSKGLLKKVLNHRVLNHLIQLLAFKTGFVELKFYKVLKIKSKVNLTAQ